MVADYYTILDVPRTATFDDLRKAYHRLAMKWHPDKNPSNVLLSDAKFKQISEAYDVLSDPVKRQHYDDSGRAPPPTPPPPPPPSSSSAYGGGSYSFGGRPFVFDPDRDYKKIFEEMARSGYKFPGMKEEEKEAKKQPAIERSLGCSLEDLYNGAIKLMKITRTITDSSGNNRIVREVLTIDIKVGWKKGTTITFLEKGNQRPGIIPSDIIFVVDEKTHGIFKRDGDDLILNQELTLLEALTGRKTLELKTLDGRNLIVCVTEIVTPGYEKVVLNEGMPNPKRPQRKGNLRIQFTVKYPSRLSEKQKDDLQRVLGDIT